MDSGNDPTISEFPPSMWSDSEHIIYSCHYKKNIFEIVDKKPQRAIKISYDSMQGIPVYIFDFLC